MGFTPTGIAQSGSGTPRVILQRGPSDNVPTCPLRPGYHTTWWTPQRCQGATTYRGNGCDPPRPLVSRFHTGDQTCCCRDSATYGLAAVPRHLGGIPRLGTHKAPNTLWSWQRLGFTFRHTPCQQCVGGGSARHDPPGHRSAGTLTSTMWTRGRIPRM